MAALITDRELNLATLARQFLLRRAEVSARWRWGGGGGRAPGRATR